MKIFAIWASAGQVVGGVSRTDVVAWLARRRDAVIAGCSSIRIGHIDFFATPIGAFEEIKVRTTAATAADRRRDVGQIELPVDQELFKRSMD